MTWLNIPLSFLLNAELPFFRNLTPRDKVQISQSIDIVTLHLLAIY